MPDRFIPTELRLVYTAYDRSEGLHVADPDHYGFTFCGEPVILFDMWTSSLAEDGPAISECCRATAFEWAEANRPSILGGR